MIRSIQVNYTNKNLQLSIAKLKSTKFSVVGRKIVNLTQRVTMASMCASSSHDSTGAEMAAAHLQNIQVQEEPAEFVWVGTTNTEHKNHRSRSTIFDNSWKSCFRNYEEEYGLKFPTLCKADAEIAYELGRELVMDKDQ